MGTRQVYRKHTGLKFVAFRANQYVLQTIFKFFLLLFVLVSGMNNLRPVDLLCIPTYLPGEY